VPYMLSLCEVTFRGLLADHAPSMTGLRVDVITLSRDPGSPANGWEELPPGALGRD